MDHSNLRSIVAIAVGLAGSMAMGVFQIQTGLAGLLALRIPRRADAARFCRALYRKFIIPLRAIWATEWPCCPTQQC